jgi:glycosyltransferase involved in cell wall biosynthesis
MHILLITEAFPPETKSNSTLFYELAESLANKGHQVSVITRMPRYNIAEGVNKNIPRTEVVSNIFIHRYQTPQIARNIPFIRGFEQFLLAFIFLWGGLFIKRSEIVLVYSPPMPLGIAGYVITKIKGGRLIFNAQDLYPQTVIDLGLLKNRFLIWVSKKIENFLYKKSDCITVHSESNKEYIISKGASPKRVEIVYNWADTKLIVPGNKENAFSKEHNLQNKFVVSYAGTVGFAQGLEVMIDAANLLRDKKDIIFLVVGDGVKKGQLEEKVKNLKLSNVIFVKTQPLSVYPQILSSSDICLVILPKCYVIPPIPGKLLSIMAAERPVITSILLAGDAPKLVKKLKCGICIPPDSPDDLAKGIIALYNDLSLREEMGRNGRKSAVDFFSRDIAVEKYESIMKRLLASSFS